LATRGIFRVRWRWLDRRPTSRARSARLDTNEFSQHCSFTVAGRAATGVLLQRLALGAREA